MKLKVTVFFTCLTLLFASGCATQKMDDLASAEEQIEKAEKVEKKEKKQKVCGASTGSRMSRCR